MPKRPAIGTPGPSGDGDRRRRCDVRTLDVSCPAWGVMCCFIEMQKAASRRCVPASAGQGGAVVGRRLTSRPRRIPRGPVLVGPLWLGVLLAISSCTDAPSADDSTPAVTATVTAPSPDATDNEDDPEEQAVRAAYEGYWRAILAANDPPDQFHPDLARYATGEAFKSVFDAAQANRLRGWVVRLPEDSVTEFRIDVIEVHSNSARVTGCTIDDGLVIDAETGEVLDASVETVRVTATLVREDGGWKVADTRVEESWEGVAGCALE